MDKDDFDFRLENLKNDIEGNYIEIDKKLRSSEKYSKRIYRENTVASQQYFGLSLRKTDSRYLQPTLEDYKNVDRAVKGIRDKLEADILADIQKEFDNKDIINFHVSRYFEDYPAAAERAKEHLFHENRAAFNEASQKSLSQIYVEQVGQKVRQEREEAVLKHSFDTAKEAPAKDQAQEVAKEMPDNKETPEQKVEQVDVPELEVHDFDPNEYLGQDYQDHYPIAYDNAPKDGEPLDFSKDFSDSSSSKGPKDPGPDIEK
jgi:hypothetical protein